MAVWHVLHLTLPITNLKLLTSNWDKPPKLVCTICLLCYFPLWPSHLMDMMCGLLSFIFFNSMFLPSGFHWWSHFVIDDWCLFVKCYCYVINMMAAFIIYRFTRMMLLNLWAHTTLTVNFSRIYAVVYSYFENGIMYASVLLEHPLLRCHQMLVAQIGLVVVLRVLKQVHVLVREFPVLL